MNALNLEYYSKIAMPLFAFYMMIFGNLTNSLIGKRMLNFIHNHTIIKHFIAIMTLIFFVILANQETAEEDMISIIIYTILIYVLVIITFLLHPIIICVVILFLFLIYLFSVFIDKKDKNDENIKRLEFTKHVLSMTSIMLILIGFAIHVYNTYPDGI